MKSLRLFVLLTLTLCLLGCDEAVMQLGAYGAKEKRLVLQVSGGESVVDDQKILLARLQQFPAALFSSVTTSIKGEQIEFVFVKGAPERTLVEYLVSHQGRFVAQARGGETWFTSKNITRADVSRIDAKNYLNLRVDKQTGQRLLRLSSAHVGQLVDVFFDGRLIATVKVSGPIKDAIQISMEMEPQALRWMATVLQTGEVKSNVVILENAL